MNITVEVLDTEGQIANNIRQVIVNVLNQGLTSSINPIKNRLGSVIEKGIRSQEEFTDLQFGKLQAELGLIQPLTLLNRIIERIKETIFINLNRISFSGNLLLGGLEIGILVNDGEYADLQNISDASYKSHGFEIPWLKWMLVSGYAVINNYQITYDLTPEQRNNSRSGQAVMIEGGSWQLISSRIPPNFVGYVGNNFLTRGLDSVSNEILIVIQEEFVNRL